jgi:hypothetical protein
LVDVTADLPRFIDEVYNTRQTPSLGYPSPGQYEDRHAQQFVKEIPKPIGLNF